MAITLRTNKGVALTYNEMDKNYSQFFYSASRVGGNLVLHYTGSTNLSTMGQDYSPDRTVTINLDSGTTAAALIPGGGIGSVQYNAGGGLLGGDTAFYYNSSSVQLGLNTLIPSASLHIKNLNSSNPSTIRLEGGTSGAGKRGYVEFYRNGTGYGTLGLSTDSTDIYQNTGTGNRFQIAGDDKLHITSTGVGIYANTAAYATPNKTLTVLGAIGVGTTTNENAQSTIKQLESEAPSNIVPTLAALLIEGPRGSGKGSVVVGITSDSTAAEAFAIIRRGAGELYSGKVATIYSNGNTELSGSLLVRNIAVTTADLGSAVIATSTGVLKKIDAAPVPKGGIILWSGAIVDVPTGWALCDGSNSTPDLRDRFIVGAGSTYASGSTGGSTTHDHGGTTNPHILTIDQIPYHSHSIKFGDNSGTAGYLTAQGARLGTGTVSTSTTSIQPIGGSGGHFHVINNDNSLPPYLALAYIMYKGI